MGTNSLRTAWSAGMVTAALIQCPIRAEETGLQLSAQLDAGITSSFESTPSNRVFGRLFDDQESRPVLNQALLTATKPIDPAATGYDAGFKL